ncbi:MAG: hypothetical protein C0453_01795 [Comamonadaceae bacterium]|nr:hypothetical protein [Comamonadaceae bacterium]
MAKATVNQAPEDTGEFDLHEAYQLAQECGFERDLILRSDQVQQIAARLRGISSISAVLITDTVDVKLGDYLRGGLVEAVNALANDTAEILEVVNSLQKTKAAAAA